MRGIDLPLELLLRLVSALGFVLCSIALGSLNKTITFQRGAIQERR